MPRRRKTFIIRQAKQLAAFASPIRCRIIDILSTEGPSSVRQLAAQMARKPESLYYHVGTLLDVGLLVLEEKRRVNRRSEAVYRLVAPRLVIDPKQRSEAYIEALAGTCATLLRLVTRDYRAAVAQGGVVLDGARRNLMVRRYNARLGREDLARLNRHLDGLPKLLEEYEDAASGDTYALTVVLTPLAGERRP